MRIAFITYEYSPDIPKGGIATYVEQASRLLSDRGNDVEIFCASYTRNLTENQDGILVHRCLVTDIEHFRETCLSRFTKRHEYLAFDIIESPEIHANALLIKKQYPSLPMVVKLHMASFLQSKLLNYYTGRMAKFRYFLGGIRRGKINFYGTYNYLNDIEYKFTLLADGIVAPSKAQKKLIVSEWHLPEENICVIPNPFSPSSGLLNAEVTSPVKKEITFVGKLNVHKGIVNLIKVIPLVVSKHPEALFRLIGNDSYFGARKMTMSDFIKSELKGYEKNYTLMGVLEYEDVIKNYKTSAICIFPSLWECFGLVCLEAMSAGRAVVGSKEGGMQDILNNGAGVLTDPQNIREMADALILLLDDEKLRWRYGDAARLKLLSGYNKDIIGSQMESYYQSVMARNRNII